MGPHMENNQNLNVGNGFESSVQGELVQAKLSFGSCHNVGGIQVM